MVVMDAIDETLGFAAMAGLVLGGVLLVVLGLGHILNPEMTTMGAVVSLINGIEVTNSLGNLPGLAVRLVGVFVTLLGVDISREGL